MVIEIGEILSETGGQALGAIGPAPVARISTDTRLLEKNDAFFALVGKRFDGHDFIQDALEKGARHFVVSDRSKVRPAWLKEANFILVKDTLDAYGDLARAWRLRFKVPAVAVTGSAGKTTVKELIAHLLSSKFKVLKNRGTENNLVGVPKTLFQLDEAIEVIVLEMGTNAPGEIERLSSIIRPQAAVLTTIGHSHLEGLKDLDGVREEKLSVLKHLERGGTLFVNGEDPRLADVTSGVHRIARVVYDPRIESPLVGRHNALNCHLAVQCALAFGVDMDAIQKSLASFKAVPGRLTPKALSDITFLDDSYNSNPSSFRAAIEALRAWRTNGRKGVVCGDMLELGGQSEALHREMGRLLAESHFDYVVAAGPQCAWLAEEAVKHGFASDRIVRAKQSEDAGRLCQKWAQPGDVVLVKGSRGMQMERIFECFTSSYTR